MKPVLARPTEAPLVLAERPGLASGGRAFFRGFALLAGSPETYALALVPVVAAILITSGLSILSIVFVPALLERWSGLSGAWLPILSVLATLTFLIFSVLLGIGLAQPASGPALEAIVRRVEKRIGAPERPAAPFLTDVLRSAGSALLGVGGALSVTIVLTLIGLIPGAALVTVPLNFLASIAFVGWDVCDYPLSVRGLPLGERVKVLARHARPVLGFSAAMALVALVPCGFLLLLPVGVAGSAALMHDLDRWDARERTKR